MKTKADGTPRKKHKYHSFASSENDWRTLEEVGQIVGVTKNRIAHIMAHALDKVADSVLREMHGRKPTEEAIAALARDESFTLMVAEQMELMLSSEGRSDPRREE